MTIPIYDSNVGLREALAVFKAVLQKKISGKYQFNRDTETEVARSLGVQDIQLVSNGTIALELALRTLGFSAKSKVVVPEIGYIAVANTIISLDLVPVPCPVTRDTLQMDVGELRRICDTNEITAVVAIHNYGYMCDMKEVSEICQSYKLFLIEDCSEAIGSSFNGIAAGLFGDVATFSFFANKNITCGEGGAVHFKRTIDAKLARDISNHCVIDKTGMTTNGLGFNFRLSSILGAILLVQVKRLPRVLRKKKRVLEWYRQELSEVPVVFQNMITGNCGVPWLVNIKFSSKDLRDNVLAGLEANGVEVRKIFPPLAQEFYGKHINFAASNNAREIYDTWLSLPSYPDISRKDVRRISKVIKCQVTKNQLTRDQSIN